MKNPSLKRARIVSYSDMCAAHSKRLKKVLKRAGVASGVIDDILDSGYILWHDRLPGYQVGPPDDVVQDGLYGIKWGYGFVPLQEFLHWAKDVPRPVENPHPAPTYRVKSVQEMKDILARPRHAGFLENGRMSFRGQTKEYFIQRAFANRNKSDDRGRERLIIPSYWRQFLAEIGSRPARREPDLLLTSPLAAYLHYGDIADWERLEERRSREFGEATRLVRQIRLDSSTFEDRARFEEFLRSSEYSAELRRIDNLADAPYREYCKRWVVYNLTAEISEEPVLIEQHYGLPTVGLDITFDLEVAAFFATQKFFIVDAAANVADYAPIAQGKHEGVIYCFVFEDPPVVRSDHLVKRLGMFEHCPPLRPLKQSCGFEFFHAENFNEAATELDAIFYLDAEFDMAQIPSKNDLFPGPKDDRFYDALLALKKQQPELLGSVVEYAF